MPKKPATGIRGKPVGGPPMQFRDTGVSVPSLTLMYHQAKKALKKTKLGKAAKIADEVSRLLN